MNGHRKLASISVSLFMLVILATGFFLEIRVGRADSKGPASERKAKGKIVLRAPGGTLPLTDAFFRSQALVLLYTDDLDAFHAVVELARQQGASVHLAYPPNAFIAALTQSAEVALREHPLVAHIEMQDAVDPASVSFLQGQAETAAHVWNTVFMGLPDAIASQQTPGPLPHLEDSDALIPPPELPGIVAAPSAPSSTQTSEFMAGTVVVSVVFVESSGGTGNCSPADPQTENWDPARQTTVLNEINEGLAFWTARSNRPDPLTFILDNRGIQRTSCEPINRPSTDQGRWIADVLTAMGFPATTSNYFSVARSFANSRRSAFEADWGYLIFVVDSLNDADGMFSNNRFAYAYLNGPFTVMTYDNDSWGISRMNIVTAHETGHIFGALDEYASSCCATTHTWGYLNAANTSCNNGGNTGDISIMGESSEQVNTSVDVSSSARAAIGWRNPAPGAGGRTVVDVVRTATVSLTPYTPDPTTDTTPTYSATASNTPFPPGGTNSRVDCQGITTTRTPSPVTISRVAGAEWNLDGGAFSTAGVIPNDGSFNGETEAYTFTPASPVGGGTHTFGTRSINNFGHISSTVTDILTISVSPLPDLLVSSVSNPPGSVAPGGSFPVTDTTWNQGTATAGASTTRYRLSTDNVITSSDPLLTGSRSVPSLAPGTGSMGSVTVTIPTTIGAGTYYLGACADDLGAVSESNEANNCRASTTTVQVQGTGGTLPDLVVTALTAPSSGTIGGQIPVSVTVANQGSGSAGPFRAGFYFSTDTTITTSDVFSGWVCNFSSGLAAGTSGGCSGPIGVPSSLAPGTYYLGAIADDQGAVAESNETNNTRSAGPITLSAGGCTTFSQLLVNPGFESGNVGWITTSGVIDNSPSPYPARTGGWKAWLNGYGTVSTDYAYQQITIPSNACSATLTFWLWIDSAETTTTTVYDRLQVQILDSSGNLLATLATYSNVNETSGYVQRSFNLIGYRGQTIRIRFYGTEDFSLQTSFLIDDVAVVVTQ